MIPRVRRVRIAEVESAQMRASARSPGSVGPVFPWRWLRFPGAVAFDVSQAVYVSGAFKQVERRLHGHFVTNARALRDLPRGQLYSLKTR